MRHELAQQYAIGQKQMWRGFLIRQHRRFPNWQIAQQLALSANTISTYRARIFEKLGLNNPAELFSYAARHKLAG